jgi:two-component system sensor histidine kinase VicK
MDAIHGNLLHLTERSSQLFLIYDLKSDGFLYMNPACLSFFDLHSIETSPLSLLDMIHVEDRDYVMLNLKKCISGNPTTNIECRVTRGANFRWIRVTPFLIIENNQYSLVVQAEDITTVKTNIEVLYSHNNKKNSILTILAHDLAGPLGAIQNYATLLNRVTKPLEDNKVNKIISSIDNLSKSGIHLIQSFLNQEFLESTNVNLLKKRIELIDRLKNALSIFAERQNELNIEFEISSNIQIVYVELDEDKFMQVINNLISNALKFTPNGGKINIHIQGKKETILISIADTGIGIPQAFHNTLFDKFTNARRPGLNGEESTGLGMSIIKTIIEWHGGSIWFNSKENIGTTFFIEIPVS